MAVSPLSAPPALDALWDPAEGRRVPGGPTVPDPPASGGSDELSFQDLLSIINPLQHLPVVSSLYRWITGDTIKPAARVIGGALYGGPFGLVTAALNAVVEQVKGGDLGAQVLAALGGDAPPERQIAAAADAAPAGEPATEPADESAPSALQPRIAASERKPVHESASLPAALVGVQGRDLAFYRANAGRPLAPAVHGREAVPIRAAELRRPAVSGPMPATTVAADERDKAAARPQPSDAAPDSWFAAAMMHALDRYRAMQRTEKPRPQIDISQ